MPLPKKQPNNHKARKLAAMRGQRPAAPEVAKTPTGTASKIPKVSDLDCAFPTRYRELLPPMSDLTPDERQMRGPFCEAVNSLFFSGGRLSDHGIFPKPGIDMTEVMRYLRATLGDFGPSHEHKIGGIGHMLAKWCDHKPK